MQLATCSGETRYQIFLDLQKACDSINRSQVFKILKKYKIGENIRNIIEKVWNKQQFVLR